MVDDLDFEQKLPAKKAITTVQIQIRLLLKIPTTSKDTVPLGSSLFAILKQTVQIKIRLLLWKRSHPDLLCLLFSADPDL